MKALLTGFLLLASPLQAQTVGNCKVIDCPTDFLPKPVLPSTTARQKVAAALAAIKTTAGQEAVSVADLKKRTDEIRAELEKQYNRLPQWMIDRIVTPDKVQEAALSDREYLAKQETLRTAIAENYNAHNAAILAAATEYQLFPPVMDFTGDPRAASVNMVAKSWFPRYSRHETIDKDNGSWRKRNPQDLIDEAGRDGAVAAALTHGDGSIGIFDNAFSTPEELAVLIFHETSHWVDVAGRSGGFKKSDLPEVSFRTEQRAYAQAAAFAAKLGLNPQWHLDRAARFELQAKECEDKHLTWPQVILKQGWIGKDRKGLLAMAPVESENSAGDEELLRQRMYEAQATAAAQVREQLEIAHRDHDERLKNTLVDLVQRSCADPGSITQSELDSLAAPFRENFFYVNPATGELPEGLGNCASLYISLGRGARLDAEEVRRQSVAISPDQVARQPVPIVAVPAVPQPNPPFSTILASLKEFSVTACREPERVELDSFLFRLYDHSYRDYDDNIAKDLAVNLDQCSRRLFYQMIGIIRARELRQLSAIDRHWIRTTVASFLKVPDSSPGYVPPSSGGGGGRRCEEFGNIRCP